MFGLHGITRIAAKGLPLDPNQHQAMLEVPTDEAEPGTVVQEMQAGYMIKDRLLRPAMVAVAKKPVSSDDWRTRDRRLPRTTIRCDWIRASALPPR